MSREGRMYGEFFVAGMTGGLYDVGRKFATGRSIRDIAMASHYGKAQTMLAIRWAGALVSATILYLFDGFDRGFRVGVSALIAGNLFLPMVSGGDFLESRDGVWPGRK